MMSNRSYFVDRQRIIGVAEVVFSRTGVARSPQFARFSRARATVWRKIPNPQSRNRQGRIARYWHQCAFFSQATPKTASAGHRDSGSPTELVAEYVSARSGGAATASLGLASGRTGALRLAAHAASARGPLCLGLASRLRGALLHRLCHCFLSFSFPVKSCPKRTNHNDLRRVKM
jgi:hypothetical protein